jgi:hypothetical protein
MNLREANLLETIRYKNVSYIKKMSETKLEYRMVVLLSPALSEKEYSREIEFPPCLCHARLKIDSYRYNQ